MIIITRAHLFQCHWRCVQCVCVNYRKFINKSLQIKSVFAAFCQPAVIKTAITPGEIYAKQKSDFILCDTPKNAPKIIIKSHRVLNNQESKINTIPNWNSHIRNWRKLFGFLSKSIIYHMCSMKDGKKSKSPPLRFVLHWSLLFLQFKSTQNKCSKAFDSKSKRFASSSYTKMHHWYGMLRTECVMSFESAFKKHSASFVSVCSFVCES